ncbi:MAG TPA: hypothetical protein VHG10_03115 [Glycomyces sp.]|nr:hypothetical protein [Glycomyces sp.]
MRGTGSDQGGHWPVGLWLALVGMSAGTVASFSLIGWTFTRGLYVDAPSREPLGYESETVILEAEETPEPAGGAGSDGLEGLAEPGKGPEIAASPAEPRAERVPESVEHDHEASAEEPREERAEIETTEPPQLVPVNEGGCDGEAGAPEDDHGGHEWGGGIDWVHDWNQDWDADEHLDELLDQIEIELPE